MDPTFSCCNIQRQVIKDLLFEYIKNTVKGEEIMKKKKKNKSYIKLLKYSKKIYKISKKIPLILAPLLLLVSIMTPFF